MCSKWRNCLKNQEPILKQFKILNKEVYMHSQMNIKLHRQDIMNKSKIFSLIAALIAVSFIVVGCASTGSSTRQVDRSDWEWVPSIWVEDNSFAGDQFSRCSYDQATNYYICPPGTK
jgi:hypothetical protein